MSWCGKGLDATLLSIRTQASLLITTYLGRNSLFPLLFSLRLGCYRREWMACYCSVSVYGVLWGIQSLFALLCVARLMGSKIPQSLDYKSSVLSIRPQVLGFINLSITTFVACNLTLYKGCYENWIMDSYKGCCKNWIMDSYSSNICQVGPGLVTLFVTTYLLRNSNPQLFVLKSSALPIRPRALGLVTLQA